VPIVDWSEYKRQRDAALLHGYRLGHDPAYAAAEKDRQRRDRARRKALEDRLQQALDVAPEVGDQVQLCIPRHPHDGATGTVKAIKVDHACAQVLATLDLKPKPRTTTLPAWAKRIRRGREGAMPGREADPLGVAKLSPIVVRLEGIPVQCLRPVRLWSVELAASADVHPAPHDEHTSP
jgi:hypothetical protein